MPIPAYMLPTDLPLSDRMRQLLEHAEHEAAQHQHEYVGTEHLALALSGEGTVDPALTALSVDADRMYAMIDGTVRRGTTALPSMLERPLTSRTKRVFDIAAETAKALGRSDIDVEEFLVGLMRERVNIAAQVLADQGLTAERAYAHARENERKIRDARRTDET